MMLDLKPEFSKYRYVIDTGSDGRDRFSVFRFDENITSKVMNNVLLDLMMAYEQLNDKLSDNTELKKLKAADTKSVKRGKWFNPPGKARCETHCTRCYGKIMKDQTGAYIETLFCPHCGADMRVPIE